MQFINIVVHSVEDMNFRVHLQYEFTKLGLDEYLDVSMSGVSTAPRHGAAARAVVAPHHSPSSAAAHLEPLSPELLGRQSGVSRGPCRAVALAAAVASSHPCPWKISCHWLQLQPAS